jgi:phosphotransacetylase
MPETKSIEPKTRDWIKPVTSNPFIARELAARGPVDVMLSGVAHQTGNFGLLEKVKTLHKRAESTGVLDTASSPFIIAARIEARYYWITNPIKSMRGLLRIEKGKD